MKILQIIQRPQRRGAEIFACQLSMELQALGNEVDMVCLFENDSFELEFPLTFHSLGGHASRRFTDFRAYKALAVLITEGKYDLVQANAGDTLKYAAISKFLHGWTCPLIFRNANKMSAFIRGRIHHILNRWFLKRCTYFISVSENCRQDLVALFPPASDCSRTITIGTYSMEEIMPVAKQDSPLLINIGSLVPEKNHIFLLEILREILKTYPAARLWVFGEGKERAHIESAAEKFELSEKVILWGNRPDAISHLKSADVMVMPSHIEGLPGVILEAMSCRVPVIAAPVGGIPEVVKNGVTGFTPSEYDAVLYAETVRQCLENVGLREKITANAHLLIQNKYLMPVIAHKFAECYKNICEE